MTLIWKQHHDLTVQMLSWLAEDNTSISEVNKRDNLYQLLTKNGYRDIYLLSNINENVIQ